MGMCSICLVEESQQRKGGIEINCGERICENGEKVVDSSVQSCINRLSVTQLVWLSPKPDHWSLSYLLFGLYAYLFSI